MVLSLQHAGHSGLYAEVGVGLLAGAPLVSSYTLSPYEGLISSFENLLGASIEDICTIAK